MRKALNDAVAKYRLIDFNPALNLEMAEYDRPSVRVWTPAAITQWQASGFKPSPVMVWTPDQAGQFLDYAQAHDPQLYALFLIVILAGPRRGEAAGIRTDEVDFGEGTLTFSHQLTTLGYKPVYKKVKTRSGDRVVFIDNAALQDLKRYWKLRQSWQAAVGEAWPDTVDVASPVPGGYTTAGVDLFFRQPNGRAWHPNVITTRFEQDAAMAGLPPIRFHDGRHAAATYLKAAGGDLLDMKKKLGHASITVTADTYPATLEEIDRTLAERTAALIPRHQTTHDQNDLIVPGNGLPTDLEKKNDTAGQAAEHLSRRRPEHPHNIRTAPDSPSNAPFAKSNTRAAKYRPERRDNIKTQGTQRTDPAPPAVFLAPTSARPIHDQWPPTGQIPPRPALNDPVTWTGAGHTHPSRGASSMAELRTFNP